MALKSQIEKSPAPATKHFFWFNKIFFFSYFVELTSYCNYKEPHTDINELSTSITSKDQETSQLLSEKPTDVFFYL